MLLFSVNLIEILPAKRCIPRKGTLPALNGIPGAIMNFSDGRIPPLARQSSGQTQNPYHRHQMNSSSLFFVLRCTASTMAEVANAGGFTFPVPMAEK